MKYLSINDVDPDPYIKALTAMKPVFLIIIMTSFLLTGCLTVSKYSYSIDFKTGVTEIVYHDIRSAKGVEKDYSIEKDWSDLLKIIDDKKLRINDNDSNYDLDIVETPSKELFKENNILSGRVMFKVKCPKCFPSKAALLMYIVDNEDSKIEMINEEIFLFFPLQKKILSSNGKIVNTENNNISIWSRNIEKLKYSVIEGNSAGKSLLSFYLKESNKSQGN